MNPLSVPLSLAIFLRVHSDDKAARLQTALTPRTVRS